MAFPTFYISLFQSGNQCLFVVSGLFKFERRYKYTFFRDLKTIFNDFVTAD